MKGRLLLYYFILIITAIIVMAISAYAVPYKFSWTASTVNEDGTPLTDLAGYRLYEDGAKVKDCGNTVSCVYDVPEGSHVYTVRAYDTVGNESKDSPSKNFVIQVCPMAPATLDAVEAENDH